MGESLHCLKAVGLGVLHLPEGPGVPGLGQAVGMGVAGPHLSLLIFSPRNDRWSPAAAASLLSSCSLSRGDRRPFPTKVSYEGPRTLLLSLVHSPPDLGSQGPGCSDWPALGHPLPTGRSRRGSSGIDSRVLPQRGQNPPEMPTMPTSVNSPSSALNWVSFPPLDQETPPRNDPKDREV